MAPYTSQRLLPDVLQHSYSVDALYPQYLTDHNTVASAARIGSVDERSGRRKKKPKVCHAFEWDHQVL